VAAEFFLRPGLKAIGRPILKPGRKNDPAIILVAHGGIATDGDG
jgi:hypothetical protein